MLALGLMAKPTLVTVPPLLLLLDFWPLGRFGQAADLPGRRGLAEAKFLVLGRRETAAVGDCAGR